MREAVVLSRGGASGGIGPEEESDQYRRAERQADRIRGDHGVDPGDLELAADDAEDHAGDPSEQRDQHRLDEKLDEDVRAPGAYGLADADLPRALGDRHEHDVHDADPAHQQ